MNKLHLKLIVLVVGLCCGSFNAWAQLSTPKADVNSVNGDRAVVIASFPEAVQGDLYIAVPIGSGYLFFGNQGSLLTDVPVPFLANENFSKDITVIDLPVDGIPAGKYSVFQLVVKAGANPYNLTDWVGGLSQVDVMINMNNTAANTDAGKALYKSLTCASSSCHGVNPQTNKDKVLNGTSVPAIRLAIQKNPSDMGFLSDTSDADLQAVADYLKTFK